MHRWLQSSDFTDPRLAVIHEVIGELVAADTRPDPVAVLAHARATGRTRGQAGVHDLAGLLHELYGHPAVVPASAAFYAASALGDTLRRRTGEMAGRLAQVADRVDLDDLVELLDREHAAIHVIRRRRAELLAQPTAPRLAVVR
jgi:replicative DNA helicase